MSTASMNETLLESVSMNSPLLTYGEHIAMIESKDDIDNEPAPPVEPNKIFAKENKITSDIVSYGSASASSSDFRIGGLGRSRGRKAKFQQNRIRGLYDDPDTEEGGDVENDAMKARKEGVVVFCPRKDAGPEGGWLCFVVDSVDQQRRACALRTVIDLSSALEGVGMKLTPGMGLEYPCTYVLGTRRQRWALLGGEVEGLTGETAISVRLRVIEVPLTDSSNYSASESIGIAATPRNDNEADADTPDIDREAHPFADTAAKPDYVVPPVGSFRKHCNICKQQFTIMHPFYHLLCGRCGNFNLEKRMQTTAMKGYVCLVTGGRVRIGYQICLKLLRAGATVITTTRWPRDAVLRYSSEHDYAEWSSNLSIDFLEMSDMALVESYCEDVMKRHGRIHVLINNAAQTLTRPKDWTAKMDALEKDSYPLSITSSDSLASITNGPVSPPTSTRDNNNGIMILSTCGDELIRRSKDEAGHWITLDGSGQPLDLSGVNSWSKRLGEISTEECVQTLAVNATAPFVLCSKLKQALVPVPGSDRCSLDSLAGHIVNVTALEGKFNVGKKSGGHPHTNMAKAALNMLTLTSARCPIRCYLECSR
jgi:NAD(P)-dependent dehydrogenase (short-subunit alcohol dehydrogenase family)